MIAHIRLSAGVRVCVWPKLDSKSVHELMKCISWMQGKSLWIEVSVKHIDVNEGGCVPCILRLSWYCIMKYSWLCCSFLRSFSVSWVNIRSSSNAWFIWWYFCDMLSIKPPTGELDCQSQTHMSDNQFTVYGSTFSFNKIMIRLFQKNEKKDSFIQTF